MKPTVRRTAPRPVSVALTVTLVAFAGAAAAGAEPTDSGERSELEAASEAEFVRIAGDDRVATAVQAARTAFPGTASAAVLATGQRFPDALAAGPLAASLDGPLLLLPARVDDTVAEELERLGADRVELVGGVTAISYLAETDVTAAGLEAARTAGESRFDTAALLSRRVAPEGADEVVLASGTDFPDAVSAAALAGAHTLPVLLTRSDRLPADTAAALDALGVERTTVVGGPDAVSPDVLESVPGPALIAGEDRTATSVAIADEALARGATLDDVVVASARAFPDALAGAALAASLDAPMLLVEPDPERVGAAVGLLADEGTAVRRVLVVGGPAAVPEAVVDVLVDALRGAATDADAGTDTDSDEASGEDGDG